MDAQEEWITLRNHIDALSAAAAPIVAWAHHSTHFGYANDAAAMVGDDMRSLWDVFIAFIDRHRCSLPDEIEKSRSEWQQRRLIIRNHASKSQGRVHEVVLWQCLLASVRGQMDRMFSNTELIWRSLAERAFEHLQRVIVADEIVRQKWQIAYETEGEERCEGHGAVHLLHHGIWAFKAHSEGERTDLVLQDNSGPALVRRGQETGTVLVLTEWKKIPRSVHERGTQRYRKELDMHRNAAVADIQKQVILYRNGSLAAIELHSACYGVLVSWDRIQVPAERPLGSYTLKFVNIAVDPRAPSKEVASAVGTMDV